MAVSTAFWSVRSMPRPVRRAAICLAGPQAEWSSKASWKPGRWTPTAAMTGGDPAWFDAAFGEGEAYPLLEDVGQERALVVVEDGLAGQPVGEEEHCLAGAPGQGAGGDVVLAVVEEQLGQRPDGVGRFRSGADGGGECTEKTGALGVGQRPVFGPIGKAVTAACPGQCPQFDEVFVIVAGPGHVRRPQGRGEIGESRGHAMAGQGHGDIVPRSGSRQWPSPG